MQESVFSRCVEKLMLLRVIESDGRLKKISIASLACTCRLWRTVAVQTLDASLFISEIIFQELYTVLVSY